MKNMEQVEGSSSAVRQEQACRAGKYLTFRLDAEEYGLEILKVREIIGLMEITKVPRTPDYIRGIVNLRGKIIPVLDLRLKFGMSSIENSDQTCIIVVDVESSGNVLMVGILVDAVSEVLDIQAEEIEDAPSFGASIDTRFIMGIGKVRNTVKILLDIDCVMVGVEFTAHSLAEEMGDEAMEEEEASLVP